MEMVDSPAGQILLGAAPWMLLAIVMLWRARGTQFLDSHSPRVEPPWTPSLSVVIPARNEEHNIERCASSLLASEYPDLEIVIVDDHSEDATAAIARALALKDDRVRLTSPPALPEGWFGKQWACHHGAAVARGEILLFTDADTWHHPELHARLVNALRDLDAGLVSIGGEQEANTFWEKLVQPLVFLLLALRYGGPGVVNRSRNPRNKIANGQCILTSREAYDRAGGHAAVRGTVAEDLKLAQLYAAAGLRPMLLMGTTYFSTRMYRSLSEVVQGWGKNIYAGSLETLPRDWFTQRIAAPLLLVLPPLLALVLPLALLGCLIGLPGLPCYPIIGSTLSLLLLCAAGFAALRVHPIYAPLFPLGAAVLLYIVLSAIARGRRVTWKGRAYTSGRGED